MGSDLGAPSAARVAVLNANLDADELNLEELQKLLKQAQTALIQQAEECAKQEKLLDEKNRELQTKEANGIRSHTDSGPRSNNLLFSLDQLKTMLQREDDLRTSEETQKAYAEAELKYDSSWLDVTEDLQRRLLLEFGVSPENLNLALAQYRQAPNDHPELKQYALYHRNQRSRQGDLNEGDLVPQGISLVDLSCHSVDFSALTAGPRPLVVLAGSWT